MTGLCLSLLRVLGFSSIFFVLYYVFAVLMFVEVIPYAFMAVIELLAMPMLVMQRVFGITGDEPVSAFFHITTFLLNFAVYGLVCELILRLIFAFRRRCTL